MKKLKTKPVAAASPRLLTKKPEPAAPNIRIPAWVNEDPTDSTESYHLIAENPRQWDQFVELTRSEYLLLKDHIAELRGYKVPAEAAHA